MSGLAANTVASLQDAVASAERAVSEAAYAAEYEGADPEALDAAIRKQQTAEARLKAHEAGSVLAAEKRAAAAAEKEGELRRRARENALTALADRDSAAERMSQALAAFTVAARDLEAAGEALRAIVIPIERSDRREQTPRAAYALLDATEVQTALVTSLLDAGITLRSYNPGTVRFQTRRTIAEAVAIAGDKANRAVRALAPDLD